MNFEIGRNEKILLTSSFLVGYSIFAFSLINRLPILKIKFDIIKD